jgi:hypothetical protein
MAIIRPTGGLLDHAGLDNLAWSVAGHTIDTNLIPSTSGLDLGSTSHMWDNIYLNARAEFGTDGKVYLMRSGDNMYLEGDRIDLYADNGANQGIIVYADLYPYSERISIGNLTHYWEYGYITNLIGYNVTLSQYLKFLTANCQIWRDASENLTFKDENAGTLTLSELTGGGLTARDSDAAAWDYNTADFTKDGAWHDLDLSSIVPAGKNIVWLRVIVRHSAANAYAGFRKNGNNNLIEAAYVRTQYAWSYEEQQIQVKMDANRVIEYLCTPSLNTVSVHVMGWV